MFCCSSQFQKEYPDIYLRRFPTTESEAQLFADKPKIKPPMLLSLKKPKTLSIRNWIPLKNLMNEWYFGRLSLKTFSWSFNIGSHQNNLNCNFNWSVVFMFLVVFLSCEVTFNGLFPPVLIQMSVLMLFI